MIYNFISEYSYKWSIEMMCRVLGVSRSSYYQWLKYPVSKRELCSMELDKRIQSAYDKSKGRYGSPRLAKELQQSGIRVSTKTVAKHMQSMGLKVSCHVDINPLQIPTIKNL